MTGCGLLAENVMSLQVKSSKRELQTIVGSILLHVQVFHHAEI